MQEFKVSDLIPHEKNEFYFDEMSGQKWTEFLESVRTSGVIEPPVVTDKRVIVSGHQRVRACKELGIDAINCEVRIYDSEDRVLKDLIETNIRQRGTIAGSEMKMGRIIKELERIYDVKRGRPTKNTNNVGNKTQADIAADLNIDNMETYRQNKSLTDLPVEFQELIDVGKITPSTASRVIVKLSEEEQMQLLENLPVAQKHTQSQVQQYIDQIRGLTEEKEVLAQEAVEACRAAKSNQDGKEYLRLQERLEAEREKSRKIYEDYQELRKKNDSADAVEEATSKVKAEYRKLIDAQEKKIADLESRLFAEESSDISNQILRVHTSDSTQEQILNDFSMRIVDCIGSYLPVLRGLEVQTDLCSKLSDTTKALLRREIGEINQIHARLDAAIIGGTSITRDCVEEIA